MRTVGRVVAVVAAIGVVGWVAAIVVLGETRQRFCDHYANVSDGTLTGVVFERNDEVVTFDVETTEPIASEIPSRFTAGERVTVVYDASDARCGSASGTMRLAWRTLASLSTPRVPNEANVADRAIGNGR